MTIRFGPGEVKAEMSSYLLVQLVPAHFTSSETSPSTWASETMSFAQQVRAFAPLGRRSAIVTLQASLPGRNSTAT